MCHVNQERLDGRAGNLAIGLTADRAVRIVLEHDDSFQVRALDQLTERAYRVERHKTAAVWRSPGSTVSQHTKRGVGRWI